MQNRNVLISGAGIAGTALAYWLRHHGFRPTVVERASALREGGYKIDIRGAALDVVSRAGVLDAIREQRTDVQGGSIVNAAGKRVATLDGDTFGGRAGHDAEILRGDLNRILYDLGADGLHSNTRALVFGPEERFIRDLGYYVSIYSVPNHLDLDRWELTSVAPLRTALTYSTAKDTGAFLFASEPLGYDRHDVSRQKKLLAEAYAGEAWEAPRLLAALEEAPDFSFGSLSQARLDP
ncbi:FAD-dependent monooxygenase, partial [Streptomyces sp. NPDC059956]|uniref:FAD-dependent monooxygenase n=1 Tax=Streptomyces sp. NPDC059956 TaxID=3347015 RepID=UPI0036656EB1